MLADRGDRARLGHPPRLQDRQAEAARGTPPRAPWARPSRRRGWPAGCDVSRPSSSGSTPIQIVGTPAATVTRSSTMRSAMAVGDRSGPGITRLAPGRHRGVGQAPRVGVEHRHDRQHDVALADAEAVDRHGADGVQVRRAVAVDDALGVAGGAARVAHRRRPVLVVDLELDGLGARRAAPRSRAPAARRRPAGTSPLPSSMTTRCLHGLERRQQRQQQAGTATGRRR